MDLVKFWHDEKVFVDFSLLFLLFEFLGKKEAQSSVSKPALKIIIMKK
jgi:hypothetical protein